MTKKTHAFDPNQKVCAANNQRTFDPNQCDDTARSRSMGSSRGLLKAVLVVAVFGLLTAAQAEARAMTYALVQSIDRGISEPASLVIFGTGLVCAALLLRRRMKASIVPGDRFKSSKLSDISPAEDSRSSVSVRGDFCFGGVPAPQRRREKLCNAE